MEYLACCLFCGFHLDHWPIHDEGGKLQRKAISRCLCCCKKTKIFFFYSYPNLFQFWLFKSTYCRAYCGVNEKIIRDLTKKNKAKDSCKIFLCYIILRGNWKYLFQWIFSNVGTFFQMTAYFRSFMAAVDNMDIYVTIYQFRLKRESLIPFCLHWLILCHKFINFQCQYSLKRSKENVLFIAGVTDNEIALSRLGFATKKVTKRQET